MGRGRLVGEKKADMAAFMKQEGRNSQERAVFGIPVLTGVRFYVRGVTTPVSDSSRALGKHSICLR